jgi:hypothetical protein
VNEVKVNAAVSSTRRGTASKIRAAPLSTSLHATVQRPTAGRDTNAAGTHAASVAACVTPFSMVWHDGVCRQARQKKVSFVKLFR